MPAQAPGQTPAKTGEDICDFRSFLTPIHIYILYAYMLGTGAGSPRADVSRPELKNSSLAPQRGAASSPA